MIGTVRSYDARRGLGIIEPESGGADVPVHISEVERAGLASLTIGEKFSFDIKTDLALGRSFAVNLGRA
jgi:CspA family cold shock protein